MGTRYSAGAALRTVATLHLLFGAALGLGAGCSGEPRDEGAAPGPDVREDGGVDVAARQVVGLGRGARTDADAPTAPVVVHHDVPCGSNETYWPEEEHEIYWHVQCASPLTKPPALPAGATFDLASGTIAWSPALDQAGPFEIVITDADGGATRISGTVLDRFDAPGNEPLVDPASYLEEHGLPVIHLTWHSDEPMYCKDAVPRDPVPADILVGGVAHPGAELRCRGSTSLAFPKKSFTLRFTSAAPFHAPPSLAAFEGRRRLVLTQTFDDASHVRTRLGFELWNRLDPLNIRIDHASVVVFVDGEYQGLYQLTDNVGDHLMAARGLDKDGNIFKSVSHAGNYRATTNGGAVKPDLTVGYEKSDGEPEDDFSDLTTLLTWVTSSSNDELEASIDSVLRTEDFLDWYVLMTSLVAYDNFAKNSNVYIDSDGPDRRFRYIPWDLNATFGQSWNMQRIVPLALGKDSPSPPAANGIWQRITESPTLLARLHARFAAALSGPMSLGETLALFDQTSEEVRASALRDDRKWDAVRQAYPGWPLLPAVTTFDAERAYVRAWIEERWLYLTSLYVTP
ncbi:MAG: CotH kinase family protein [Labilithrix sp.]|nr:CotH kinase family protein [Labilithrix sp.]